MVCVDKPLKIQIAAFLGTESVPTKSYMDGYNTFSRFNKDVDILEVLNKSIGLTNCTSFYIQALHEVMSLDGEVYIFNVLKTLKDKSPERCCVTVSFMKGYNLVSIQ